MELNAFLSAHPKLAIAFSGGADSSYLLWAAKATGCDLHAYFVKSVFQPAFELEDARRLTESLSVPFTVEYCDVLQHPTVASNPADRCYHCKKALFSRLWELARADGFSLLCDGTNASDEAGDRPGMRALAELGVRSPLRECGLTKPEIRRRSKEAGLFTHAKPAYACLATRIPTGTIIAPDMLDRVERAETSLFALGFSDFRVRYFHGAARIQVPQSQFPLVGEHRAALLQTLAPLFDGVLLDCETR